MSKTELSSHEHDHTESDDHGHSHESGHAHHHLPPDASDALLGATVLLNVVLSVAQLGIGIFASSVALIADALHNTADAAALLIAFAARKISRRPPDQHFTFGYQRIELIAAMINLTALIVLSGFLISESVQRFLNPEPVLALWVMVAAGVALVIDIATVLLLWSSSKDSLNVRAAFLHNLSDAGTSLAVLGGAIVIHYLGWYWVDPLLGLVIAAYILVTAIVMIRQVAALLMNRIPKGISVSEVQEAFLGHQCVEAVHHLHVWQLDEHQNAVSAHLVLRSNQSLEETQVVTTDLKAALSRLRIHHVTLQFEPPGSLCDDQTCRSLVGKKRIANS